MSAIVLCIPRVFSNITEQRIFRIFEQLDLGVIGRIDMVSTTNKQGETFNRVFVHFESWYRNANADTAFTRLHQGNEIKIIYDEPWFWKVSLYRKKEHQEPQQKHYQPQRQQRAVARIEFQETARPVQQPQHRANPLPIAPCLSATAPAQQAVSRALPSSPAASTGGLNVVPALRTPTRKLNYKVPTPQAPKKKLRQKSDTEARESQNHPGPMKLSDLDLEEGEIPTNA